MANKTVTRAEYEAVCKDLDRLRGFLSDLEYQQRVMMADIRRLGDEIREGQNNNNH